MADVDFTGLPELATAAGEDLLAIIDDPSGTPVTKRITRTNFLNGLISDVAYGPSWNGVIDVAASQNAVYNKINAINEPAWIDSGSYIAPDNGSDYRIIDNTADLATFTFAANTTYILPPGVYNVATKVTIANDYVTMLGHGATIRKTATMDCIEITGNHCRIVGVEIDGNSQGWSGVAIFGSHNVIEKVTAYDNIEHGFMQDGQSTTCTYNRITNCLSYNNGHIGFSLNDAQFNVISNNVAYGNTNEGITIDSTGTGWAAGNTVVGNVLFQNSASGCAGIGMDKARCNTVTGNYVDNNGNNFSGIKTNNNIDDCYNNVITGNTFVNCGQYGVELAFGTGGTAHDNVVAGNVYQNCTEGEVLFAVSCNNNILHGAITLQKNNHGYFCYDTSDVAKKGLCLNTTDDWEVGLDANFVVIGYGSSDADPLLIRVGGVNNKQVFVGAADSGGSGYRTLRVTN